MAIDTDAKFQSATHFIMPFYPPLPTTDAVFTQADTQAIAWCYSGILAATPSVITVVRIFLTFIGKTLGLTFDEAEPGITMAGNAPGVTITGDRG